MKSLERFTRFAPVAAALLAGGASLAAVAADGLVDVGKYEYDGACAVCHGDTGRGGGPIASQMKAPMPDLTTLSRRNGGVFPFDRVHRIIDGREAVEAHGPRDMPVWGRAFRLQSSVFYDTCPPHDTESSARSRILALTEYVYRLQGR